MKYLAIPGLPIAAIYASQYLGTHLTMRPACILSGLITFAAAFIALCLLHRLVFGHKPRFF